MGSLIFIDINCDVGEGAENEEQLFPLISSCNIACGGHAGDASSMERVVRLAKKFKVKVGAHPSYPDRDNFGRAAMDIPSDALMQSIRQQISDLGSILKKENLPLHHIKAHGALYNEIAQNTPLAEFFLKTIGDFDRNILLYVPYASSIARKAVAAGFSIAYEAFADRNYNGDLSLVSRSDPQAMIKNPEAILNHIVPMVQHHRVRTVSGEEIKILADTFCIHSDTPLAFEIVSYLSQELPNHHIRITK